MDQVWGLLAALADRNVKLAVEDGCLRCYAPKGALTVELSDSIARLKPDIVRLLQRDEAPKADQPREFPLSAGEATHYLLQQLNPARSHVVPICLTIDVHIDAERLAQAWDRVIDRFPILLTRVIEHEGRPYHRLDPRCRSKLHCEAACCDEGQLAAHLRAKALEPFDLARGPLSRITLFEWPSGKRCLFILVHHIVFDGFSAGVLLRALFSAYQDVAAGRPAPVASGVSGFEAFVEWEARMLASDEGAKHAEYWRRQLQGDLPGFKLADAAQAPVADTHPEALEELLPEDTSRWLREFAKARSLQPSAMFLAAFQLLLHKFTNQNDIIVLMPVIVRPDARFADEIGYFFNTVPIRTRFDRTACLDAFLRRTQMAMLDAVFHAAYPFSLMTNAQKVDGGASFGVYFAFHEFTNLADEAFGRYRREFGLAPLPGFSQQAEGALDLSFEVFHEDGAYRIRLQSRPDFCPPRTLRSLLAQFRALLEEIGKDASRRLGQYSMSTAEDRRRIAQWNATAADFPRDRCIHAFFLDQVAAGAGRTAVVHGDRRLSYGDLERSTRTLALYLQSLGIGCEGIVAICLERSAEMMIAIHGTVRAGAAYMPIDPAYPDERVGYMLEDSAATVILTQERYRSRLQAVSGARVQVVALDADWSQIEAAATQLLRDGAVLRCDVQPHNAAYVIYTSGSTGRPKGVVVEHRALVNRIHWMQKAYGLGDADVVVQKTPYCFDVSVWEFFWPPMTGASLVFALPNGHSDVQYLEAEINRAGVTTLHFVPSMLRAFLDGASGRCPSVRLLFCSGEALDRGSVERYRAIFPNAALHNLYGPTEAAIDVTFFDCTRIAHPFVPIGAPIDNTCIHICDEDGNQQPVGVPGELHIAGENLARGYLNRPELTSERFVDNPFEPGTRMYKTGDLARWLDDGNIQYLGRIDAQVKIGGVRIEAGEIETHLDRHPAISESVVIARGPEGNKQLVAFYRTHASTRDDVIKLSHKELREHLLEVLPDSMVPAAFVRIDAIPVTSNGKADRRALEKIDVGLETSEEFAAPGTDTERRLVELWAQVFKAKGFVAEQVRIGIDDNFFELGGNSLLATQLLYRIRTQFAVELPVRALFERASIRRLAALIEDLRSQESGGGADLVVTIESRGGRVPLFALPGIGGNVLTFRELSHALGSGQPFHAVQPIGLDAAMPPPTSVEATASATIAAIRAVQPRGPYRLLGHSYGGVVCYEIARQLLEQGDEIASLVLLDSATPAVQFGDGTTDEFEAMRRLCSEIAEQGGQRFAASAEALSRMSDDELFDLLGASGIDLSREQYRVLLRLFRASRTSYLGYSPRPLPRSIDVRLYRAARSRLQEWPTDFGWGELVQGSLGLFDIDADHHSMLRGEAVAALAATLVATEALET